MRAREPGVGDWGPPLEDGWHPDQPPAPDPERPAAAGLSTKVGPAISRVYGTDRVPGRVVFHRLSGAAFPGAREYVDSLGEGGTGLHPAASSASVTVIAICDAPAVGSVTVPRFWRGKSLFLASSGPEQMNAYRRIVSIGAQYHEDGELQWVLDGSGPQWMVLPSEGIYHRGVVQMRAKYLVLIDGGVPDFSFEVKGLFAGDDGDADPADVLADLVSLAAPGTTVSVDVGPDGLAASSFRTWCAAMGFRVSLGITEQTEIVPRIEDLLAACHSMLVWSDGQFKAVPLGDTAIGAYSPPATSVLLDDNEWIRDGDEPAITVTRTPDAALHNCYPVGIRARESDYEQEVYEHIDPVAEASATGLVRASAIRNDWIKTATHARKLSSLLAARAIHVRNTFRGRLMPRWAVLDPGDLVTIRHSPLGLDTLAMLTRVDVTEDGSVEVEADEWPLGSATAIDLTPQTHDGFSETPMPPPPSEADRDTAQDETNGRLDAIEAQLGTIASDNVLTAQEKGTVLLAYHDLIDSQSALEAQAAAFTPAVSATAYTAAINALRTYFTTTVASGGLGMTADLAAPATGAVDAADEAAWRVTNTTISGATFRATFHDAYTARADLQNALVERARQDAAGGDGGNLIPNGDSERGALAGSAGAAVVNIAGAGYNGTNYLRRITSNADGYAATYARGGGFMDPVPCVPGDRFRFEAVARCVSSLGTARIGMRFNDGSAGEGAILAFNFGDVSTTASVYSRVVATGTAPASAARVSFYIEALNAGGAGREFYFDDLYAVKVSALDALTSTLTRDSTALPANADGTLIGSSPYASTTMKVMSGITDESALWSFSASPASSAASVTYTLTGTPANTLNVTGMASTVDSATITITATRAGHPTLTRDFTIAKAKTGASGTNGTNGARGSMTFYVDISPYTTWADSGRSGNDAASEVAPWGGPHTGDTLTQHNDSAGITITRYYNGSAWVVPGAVIDGTLVAKETIYAPAMASDQFRSSNFVGRCPYDDADLVANANGSFTCPTHGLQAPARAVRGSLIRRAAGLGTTDPSALFDPNGIKIGHTVLSEAWFARAAVSSIGGISYDAGWYVDNTYGLPGPDGQVFDYSSWDGANMRVTLRMPLRGGLNQVNLLGANVRSRPADGRLYYLVKTSDSYDANYVYVTLQARRHYFTFVDTTTFSNVDEAVNWTLTAGLNFEVTFMLWGQEVAYL